MEPVASRPVQRAGFRVTAFRRILTLALGSALAVTGCTRAPVPTPAVTAPAVTTSAVTTPAVPASAVPTVVPTAVGITKVLMIAEENHEYGQIIGSAAAPYLNHLAATYGSATKLEAGYPEGCPSLAAYILLTSGSTAGICDDKAPKVHRLRGDNIFHQVTASGREWRAYAQSAPAFCALTNSNDGRYLVRHVPATYYLDVRRDCTRWALPMGEPNGGALHSDVQAGTLPAFGFLSPDACHDMHGAAPCPSDRIGKADDWLRGWLPMILAGADYRAGRLAVIIVWDEGTSADNHIPTLVISPTTRHIAAGQAFTHCSTLRTTEELLRLPLLGCAARAPSMTLAFRL
jgi:hypothetical protein